VPRSPSDTQANNISQFEVCSVHGEDVSCGRIKNEKDHPYGFNRYGGAWQLDHLLQNERGVFRPFKSWLDDTCCVEKTNALAQQQYEYKRSCEKKSYKTIGTKQETLLFASKVCIIDVRQERSSLRDDKVSRYFNDWHDNTTVDMWQQSVFNHGIECKRIDGST